MSQPDNAHASIFTLVCAAAMMALAVSYTVDASTMPLNYEVTAAKSAPAFPAFEHPTAAASAIVVNHVAAYRLDQGTVKFFFASGRSDLVKGADAAWQTIVQAAQTGKRVEISGYHDAAGDMAKHEELAKQRALRVKQQLLELGVPDGQIALKKPAVTQILGSYAEARRVEVTLVE